MKEMVNSWVGARRGLESLGGLDGGGLGVGATLLVEVH